MREQDDLLYVQCWLDDEHREIPDDGLAYLGIMCLGRLMQRFGYRGTPVRWYFCSVT